MNMNLHLSLLFLSCITAGISGQRNDETKLDDGKLAERKQRHHTSRTLPYHMQSDQRVPKKKIYKVNRRKFFQKLLNEENKLKRTLQKLAKQRVYVQKLKQKEQRKLVRLQTKQKRVIKTTPALQQLEARDLRLIARENSLRGKIRVVHKKYCPDCSTTTKRTDSAETPKSTTTVVTTLFVVPRKTMKFDVVPEPTILTLTTTEKTRKTRKPNRMAIGHTTTLFTSSARTVQSTTIIPSKAPLPSMPSTSRRFTTSKTIITSRPLVEGNTNLSLNTVTHLKTTVDVTTPTITHIEPIATLRTNMLRKYKLTTTPVTEYLTDVSTDIEAILTMRTLEPSQSKLNSTLATTETTLTIETDAETKADANIKTTMPWKYKLTTTPATVEHSMDVSTDIEAVSTKRSLEASKFKFSSARATAETSLTTETIADANTKTTMPWKYTVHPTQRKIQMPVDVPEHSSHAMSEYWSTYTTSTPAATETTLTTETVADANTKTTMPWKYTVHPTQRKIQMPVDVPEHSSHAMSEYWSTSTTSTPAATETTLTTETIADANIKTTMPSRNTVNYDQTMSVFAVLTTKPDHTKYYTITNPVSRSKANEFATSPLPTTDPVFTTTDSRGVKARNKTRGQSVSSVVNSYSESENEVIMMYVSVAVSVVLMLILIISVTIYITVFRCQSGKTKDDESSVDSKYQVE